MRMFFDLTPSYRKKILTGHGIDKNKFKTIYKESNNFKRFFAESLFINNEPNILNGQQDYKFADSYYGTRLTSHYIIIQKGLCSLSFMNLIFNKFHFEILFINK